MKYISRIYEIFLAKKFQNLTSKSHKKIQEKNGYFSVFLNDSVSNAIQTNGLYEKDILIPLFDILTSNYDFSNQIAIDAGANIGNHTLFFNDFFSKVISFEPNPITFKLLEVNTYFNQDKIVINNLGLSDKRDKLKLSVLEGNIGGSSAFKDFKGRMYQDIEVLKLDEYLEKTSYQNIGLLKIDVEGMEYKVLNGSLKTLRNSKPIILFELWQEAFKDNHNQSIELLHKLGYRIFQIQESQYSKNTFIRRLRRLSLLILNSSLRYTLQEKEYVQPNNYPMLIAIHSSKINKDFHYSKNYSE